MGHYFSKSLYKILESPFQSANDVHLSYQMMHIFRGKRCASFFYGNWRM